MSIKKLNYREFYARTGSYFETSDCNASVLAKEEMWQYLRDIDKALVEAKSLIESCGYAEIPVPEYDVHAEAIDKAESDMEVLASFPQDLCNGLYDQTDKEFFKAINEKVENVLDLIKMDEITIKNDFDVMQTKYVGKDGLPQTLKKHELCISDFLGYNMFGETKSTPIEGFTDILYKPFMTDDMTLMGYVSANQKELHDLIYSGEYDAKKYQPLRQLASDVLDALSLGVIPIVKSMSGYDVITGEHLSDEERMAYFVEGAITIVMFGFDAASAAMPLIRQFMVSSVANGAGQLAGSGMELALKDVDMPDDMKFTLVMLANAGVNITVEKGLVKIGSEVVNPKELAKLQAEMGCEGSLNSVDDIIKGVENGEIKLSNNIQKGNYGEMKMDAYFESQGYKRISLDKVADLDTPTHQGIDGVYYNPNGHPPYVIGEAKYGSSRLSTLADGTPQMSDKWIIDRLENAVGEDVANDIKMEMILNPDNVGASLVHVSQDGSVVITDFIDGIKK